MRMTRSKSRRSSRSSRSAGGAQAYAEEVDSDDAEEGKAGHDAEAPSFIVVYPNADKKKNGRKIAIDRSMDPIVRRHCRLCCRLCYRLCCAVLDIEGILHTPLYTPHPACCSIGPVVSYPIVSIRDIIRCCE